MSVVRFLGGETYSNVFFREKIETGKCVGGLPRPFNSVHTQTTVKVV